MRESTALNLKNTRCIAHLSLSEPVVYREQVDLNTDSDASTTLKCLTSSPRIEEKLNTAPLTWNLPSVSLPFRWFYCGSGNLHQCLATKVPLPTSWLENAQVRDTGALFFNYRKSAVKVRMLV